MRRGIIQFPFLLFIIVFLSKKLTAQNNPYKEVSITTPNAASLGKYADVPVSHHTGIPQISIPLHTVQEGELKLSIDLSYHAGGLKVMEPASWVGAGWSLNAGGVITRTVRGTPDERWTSTSNAEQMKGYLSDDGYTNYLWQTNPTGGSKTYLKEIAAGNSDGEPDLFFFNFSGYSGKFYIGDDKVPVVLPEQDIKIEYVYTPGLRKSIESFTLTTADGIKFFFGMTPSASDIDPIERILPVSAASGYGNDGKSISSWFLNKIQSGDGLKEIVLTYEQENYGYHTISQPSLQYDFYNTSQSGGLLSKMLVDGVRLSKISVSNNNVVDFIPGQIREDLSGRIQELGDDANQQAKYLGEVKVTDNNLLCKKFVLNYSYFTDNVSSMPNCGGTTETDRKRLKLLNIQETACNGSVSIPPYQFEYFSEMVPRRMSFSQDHWGFNNGMNNTVFIPTIYQNDFYERAGGDRDSKWPAMRGGALKKISYPTGGCTELEFEPNKTWVSYNKYNPEYAFSTSVGYDGGYSSTTYQYFDNLNYKVVLSNSPCQYWYTTCTAHITIYDANNNVVSGTFGAEGGQSETRYVYIPVAGTYRIEMSKNNPASGYGASANFTKLMPLLYEANEVVGGLRIKSMTTIDPIQNPPLTKTDYNYDVNGVSSGILYSRPNYVVPIKNSGARYAYQIFFYNSATWYLDAELSMPDEYPYFVVGPAKTAFMSAGAILPMHTTQGNHIGYNEVKVSKTNNGYSIYRYYGSNIWDYDLRDVAFRRYKTAREYTDPEYPAAPLPFEYKRGELKYEGHFNQTNKLLRETNYIPTYLESAITTPGIIAYTDARPGPLNLYVSAKTDYELRSSKKTEVTTIDRVYDDITTNYITTTNTIKFESPLHSQATTQASTNSKGEEIKQKSKYVFDFTSPGCSPVNTCWTDYQTALQNNLALYGQEYNSCTTDECRRIAKSYYNARNMGSRRDYASCRRNSIAAYNTCFQNAKAAASTELKPVFELRNKYINVPLETSQWKNNKLIAASFTQYGYATNPSTHVYPNVFQKINLISPSTTFTESYVAGNIIVKDVRYIDESTIKFEAGNISEVTGKNGVTTSYIWGYTNTLPIVKALGVNYVTLKAAYDAVSGDLLLIRSQPSLSNAYLNTYFYTPGIGMIKETDPRGRSIFYYYDNLNRLVLVRDHDNNIIKKICYNYAGQVENCSSPCDPIPNWQNTTTPPTCQQGSCGNTGYQSQEQRDMNVCSPTYNQTQFVTVYNPTACPTSGVNITYNNIVNQSGFTALYTNTATSQQYSFSIPATGSGVLGCLPAAMYSLSISKPGSMVYLMFSSGCHNAEGTSAFFGKVSISTCNAVSIDYAF